MALAMGPESVAFTGSMFKTIDSERIRQVACQPRQQAENAVARKMGSITLSDEFHRSASKAPSPSSARHAKWDKRSPH